MVKNNQRKHWIIPDFIYNNFNNSLLSSYFPSTLKIADITPVFIKTNRANVKNYRPVSILPVLSKVYESRMYNQMYAYLYKILSKWQCGNWSFKSFGLPLIWSFNCQTYYLWFWLRPPLTVFIQTYRSERQQKAKVNNAYRTYSDILYGVPQGSILGPLLFNIYIRDMFYDIDVCDIAGHADNNTR